MFGMLAEFGAIIKGEIAKPKLTLLCDMKLSGGVVLRLNSPKIKYQNGCRVEDTNKGVNGKTEISLSS